ncbi:hypothetical protein PUN28_006393 [Cardiocondyla obscurior]|uniref:Uncharacterized protein n=1 Tax=Cardiocondyla obscurior TaxID=286306 RepID=A0AAW2GAI4_9HYME
MQGVFREIPLVAPTVVVRHRRERRSSSWASLRTHATVRFARNTYTEATRWKKCVTFSRKWNSRKPPSPSLSLSIFFSISLANILHEILRVCKFRNELRKQIVYNTFHDQMINDLREATN